MRYRDFCDQVRAAGVQIPPSGARILFVLPLPPSWSEKKKIQMAEMPHQQTPDLDNLLKALFDAVFADDKAIWHYEAAKRWGREGAIVIEVRK